MLCVLGARTLASVRGASPNVKGAGCENALNQVVFGFPNMNLRSGQFGVISDQANTPREIQLALKMLF